jgi:NADH:ubiquinone oxidoreductase subunit 3 (subunit A)
LLYDLELLLLLPISFNIVFLKTNILAIVLLLGVLFYTCIWDIETKTLEYEN